MQHHQKPKNPAFKHNASKSPSWNDSNNFNKIRPNTWGHWIRKRSLRDLIKIMVITGKKPQWSKILLLRVPRYWGMYIDIQIWFLWIIGYLHLELPQRLNYLDHFSICILWHGVLKVPFHTIQAVKKNTSISMAPGAMVAMAPMKGVSSGVFMVSWFAPPERKKMSESWHHDVQMLCNTTCYWIDIFQNVSGNQSEFQLGFFFCNKFSTSSMLTSNLVKL